MSGNQRVKEYIHKLEQHIKDLESDNRSTHARMESARQYIDYLKKRLDEVAPDWKYASDKEQPKQ